MPANFVYLRDVDPSILQDIRYATANNFTGQKLPGYRGAECILRRPVAEALKRVQKDLVPLNLTLKVYDCYRPERAVLAFRAWASGKFGSDNGNRYHPNISKRDVLSDGYVATRSSHSRGIAVDITIVQTPIKSKSEKFDPNKSYGSCTEEKSIGVPDNSVDMGTAFDCFDVRSHTWNKEVGVQQQKWRSTLVKAMGKQGFRNYSREWWHFTLNLDRSARHYDFMVNSRK